MCQAIGLVAAQAGCSVGAALARLHARAAQKHESLERLARDVLEQRVRFDDPKPCCDAESSTRDLQL